MYRYGSAISTLLAGFGDFFPLAIGSVFPAELCSSDKKKVGGR